MTITDDTAGGLVDLSATRALAAAWHGGMSSPLYAFASTGAITDGLVREVEECIATAEQYDNDPDYAEDIPRLRHLLVYVRSRGYRGPVEGWHNIRF